MKLFFGQAVHPAHYYRHIKPFYEKELERMREWFIPRSEIKDKAFHNTRFRYKLSVVSLGTILKGQKKL